MLTGLGRRVDALLGELRALYLAYRDPRTPLVAKVVTAVVVAYALSPIDLIPDFIPVLGYLDDLLLVPLGIAFAVHLVPDEVMRECRERASGTRDAGSWGRAGAVGVVVIWLLLAAVAIRWGLRLVDS